MAKEPKPAFPNPAFGTAHFGTGMSLIDFFAATASEKDIECAKMYVPGMSRIQARFFHAQQMFQQSTQRKEDREEIKT